jgi:hypothetical protein
MLHMACIDDEAHEQPYHTTQESPARLSAAHAQQLFFNHIQCTSTATHGTPQRQQSLDSHTHLRGLSLADVEAGHSVAPANYSCRLHTVLAKTRRSNPLNNTVVF